MLRWIVRNLNLKRKRKSMVIEVIEKTRVMDERRMSDADTYVMCVAVPNINFWHCLLVLCHYITIKQSMSNEACVSNEAQQMRNSFHLCHLVNKSFIVMNLLYV